MALASSLKANAALGSTPKASHQYSAVIAPRHLAGCSNSRQQLGQAHNCSRLLVTTNSTSLPLKQTACRVAAMDVDSVTRAPSSGSAEAHVGPAKGGLRAIVIGTGMAGLAAARILADTFDEVSRSFIPLGCVLTYFQVRTPVYIAHPRTLPMTAIIETATQPSGPCRN